MYKESNKENETREQGYRVTLSLTCITSQSLQEFSAYSLKQDSHIHFGEFIALNSW